MIGHKVISGAAVPQEDTRASRLERRPPRTQQYPPPEGLSLIASKFSVSKLENLTVLGTRVGDDQPAEDLEAR
jgi:hypothetical protein